MSTSSGWSTWFLGSGRRGTLMRCRVRHRVGRVDTWGSVMETVTFRVRSLVWFVTGAMLATTVTLMFVQAWRVDAAPGDSDTTFVPIAPGCRFADTRQAGEGGPIGPGQVRPFTAHGTHNACTIPADAVALLMNVTVDGQTATNSFLTIWGNGGNPGTSALNPAAGEPPTPNAVTTDLTPTGVFNIFNDAGLVNVIIDINGYYTKTSLQDISTRLTELESSSRYTKVDADASGVNFLQGRGVSLVSRLGVGVYRVTFAAPITECGWFATLNDNDAGISANGEISIERDSVGDTNSLRVRTFDSAGLPEDPFSDDGFSVHVVCGTPFPAS